MHIQPSSSFGAPTSLPSVGSLRRHVSILYCTLMLANWTRSRSSRPSVNRGRRLGLYTFVTMFETYSTDHRAAHLSGFFICTVDALGRQSFLSQTVVHEDDSADLLVGLLFAKNSRLV